MILSKGVKTYVGEKATSSTNGAWKGGYPHVD
jgi:hypothetical protein